MTGDDLQRLMDGPLLNAVRGAFRAAGKGTWYPVETPAGRVCVREAEWRKLRRLEREGVAARVAYLDQLSKKYL
jgi:hypothetical protein